MMRAVEGGPPPDLSIVVPVLNEEEAVGPFLDRVGPVLDGIGLSWEAVFVDDGSTDGTAAILTGRAAEDPRIRLVGLSRNFGKEAALTAGLDFAEGAAVVPMDVDLQDPPEILPDFVRLWRQGFEVVVGRRSERATDGALKRMTAGLFYRVFNAISASAIEENAGDFRLMSRRAVAATLKLRERNRFMKGLFAWVGFRTAVVPYARPARMAGRSKFNFRKLWTFALDGITSFSTLPLRVWTYIGLGVAGAAVAYTVFIVAGTLLYGRDVPGYASLMAVTLTLGAVQLISLGIIGEYLGRLYIETKQRPIYLVERLVGFPEPGETPAPPAPAGKSKETP